ncbi:FKBP-type peptidyl-prolyl cis-trans isomerase [Marivirga sp. S37H4]|uniref:Peptidyl-prolyl cis-trans isomerase n=1 Tax=Marivirga aurantiaca TaxID=2802615 RepID=A0A934WZ54_9BACT|nr:FKBP-type peptidyl-prolyl cis-trans isomerase [Marivirga aurantiaca]MBK6265878.1 FKBP-type peptidyl-prolyl cis-trans isomerase [Marivirga aurantiaca]
MNKVIFCLIAPFLMITFFSCTEERDCSEGPDISEIDQQQLNQDVDAIDDYLQENDIDYSIDPSGLRYSIVEPGTGNTPTYCSSVLVDYEGRILGEDQTFDSGTDAQFRMSGGIITGWKFGLKLMNKGADYRLFIPSVLAYGEEGVVRSDSSVVIPPNANLEFRIRLNQY